MIIYHVEPGDNIGIKLVRMAFNYKKSRCLRIGPRCDVSCANIASLNGHVLPWTNVIRYLRIFIVQSRAFKCSINEAKRYFCRAANAIFCKIGRLASEEIIHSIC